MDPPLDPSPDASFEEEEESGEESMEPFGGLDQWSDDLGLMEQPQRCQPDEWHTEPELRELQLQQASRRGSGAAASSQRRGGGGVNSSSQSEDAQNREETSAMPLG